MGAYRWAFVLLVVTGACGSTEPPRGYVSREMLGDAWPLTVENGVLACPAGSSAVTFTAYGNTYAVNGRAKGERKYLDIEPIVQTAPPGTVHPDQQVTRIAELERRRLFALLAACEERARQQAEQELPIDKRRTPAELERGSALEDRLTDVCTTAVRKREKLTAQEQEHLIGEGVDQGWPPGSPMPKSIRPLIDRGLALCQK